MGDAAGLKDGDAGEGKNQILKHIVYILVNIENYKILKNIGKGGMGEVFLAHDPICGRDVALKQMRKELVERKSMRERFLREAKIAAQLSHPSIIPIYSIAEDGTFYTMPYIEGETLKSIVRTTKEQTKTGEPCHRIGASVPALIRIFLSICGAMAYTHSRGVLHRDLKPENIIVGKFGEVIILDWGLAEFVDAPEKNGLHFEDSDSPLTQPGKIPGTLMFMAPERAFGEKSTVSGDIYSLGVILYQLLTLQFPFQRTSLKEFRKRHKYEELLDPEEVAPDRDISPHLSNITKKCLSVDPTMRFQSVSELIKELEDYIGGLPEWLDAGELDINRKEDWQFQENVPLTKHMALTRGIEMLEWVNLMISKAQFPGNIRIETKLTLKRGSKGLGVLFSVPEHNPHKGAEESYCLWLSKDELRLYRANVEVLHQQDLSLEKERLYSLKIEKIDNHVRFFLDGSLVFGFLSHIPLSGSRIGLMLRDGDFTLTPLKVAVGSQNIMVNCLAVPDAFLSRSDFDEAFKEYRKIAESFPGRAEGNEAIFRAGKTLVYKAQTQKRKTQGNRLFADALDEFEKLHYTPGAPLEYLGKSIVYKTQRDFAEEAKCLELALRKFPNHPLKPILVETILSRLHESTQKERQGAYLLALIVLRFLPHLSDASLIADVLEDYLEPLSFIVPSDDRNCTLILQLAFWLNKPLVAYEMLEKGLKGVDAQNAHMVLILLGNDDLADFNLLETPSPQVEYARFYHALNTRTPMPENLLDPRLKLWSALHQKQWDAAKDLLSSLDSNKETDLSFFLQGCYLAHKEGEQSAHNHLQNISEKAFPPIPTLLSHYLCGRINFKRGWIDKAFFWEKHHLLEQLSLFYHCLGNKQELTKIRAKKSSLL